MNLDLRAFEILNIIDGLGPVDYEGLQKVFHIKKSSMYNHLAWLHARDLIQVLIHHTGANGRPKGDYKITQKGRYVLMYRNKLMELLN